MFIIYNFSEQFVSICFLSLWSQWFFIAILNLLHLSIHLHMFVCYGCWNFFECLAANLCQLVCYAHVTVSYVFIPIILICINHKSPMLYGVSKFLFDAFLFIDELIHMLAWFGYQVISGPVLNGVRILLFHALWFGCLMVSCNILSRLHIWCLVDSVILFPSFNELFSIFSVICWYICIGPFCNFRWI